MKLRLNNIDVDCVIGERPDERTRLQRLLISVVLELPSTAAISDELTDTVDYAVLVERIRAALVAAKCKMIERAAKVVCDVCLEDKRVASVKVSVIKSGAINHLESAEVIYEQRR